jgi:hypothetical protein
LAPCGDQELHSGDAAGSVTVEQRRCLPGDQGDDLLLQLSGFLVQGQPSAAEAGQGTAEALAGIKGRAGAGEARLAQRRQPGDAYRHRRRGGKP